MTTYKTGNPLGSTAVKDLYDNAENLDVLVNDKSKLSHPDRLGVERKTWHAIEEQADQQEAEFNADQTRREDEFDSAQAYRESRFNDFIVSSGYQFLGDYAAGIEITEYNQIIRDSDGEFWRLSGQVELPYTTTGAGLPENDSLVPAGDAVLRQDLANPDKGAAMVARSVMVVDSIDVLLELSAEQRKSDMQYLVGLTTFQWVGSNWIAPNGVWADLYGAKFYDTKEEAQSGTDYQSQLMAAIKYAADARMTLHWPAGKYVNVGSGISTWEYGTSFRSVRWEGNNCVLVQTASGTGLYIRGGSSYHRVYDLEVVPSDDLMASTFHGTYNAETKVITPDEEYIGVHIHNTRVDVRLTSTGHRGFNFLIESTGPNSNASTYDLTSSNHGCAGIYFVGGGDDFAVSRMACRSRGGYGPSWWCEPTVIMRDWVVWLYCENALQDAPTGLVEQVYLGGASGTKFDIYSECYKSGGIEIFADENTSGCSITSMRRGRDNDKGGAPSPNSWRASGGWISYPSTTTPHRAATVDRVHNSNSRPTTPGEYVDVAYLGQGFRRLGGVTANTAGHAIGFSGEDPSKVPLGVDRSGNAYIGNVRYNVSNEGAVADFAGIYNVSTGSINVSRGGSVNRILLSNVVPDRPFIVFIDWSVRGTGALQGRREVHRKLTGEAPFLVDVIWDYKRYWSEEEYLLEMSIDEDNNLVATLTHPAGYADAISKWFLDAKIHYFPDY